METMIFYWREVNGEIYAEKWYYAKRMKCRTFTEYRKHVWGFATNHASSSDVYVNA